MTLEELYQDIIQNEDVIFAMFYQDMCEVTFYDGSSCVLYKKYGKWRFGNENIQYEGQYAYASGCRD